LAAEHTKDSLATVRKNIADGKAVIIDVREQDEWNEGHLRDAIFVPLSSLEEAHANEMGEKSLDVKLPKKIIYCHCRSGSRALSACSILAEWGYDVRPLKAGYEDLVEAGFPQAE
jgi:rhodanese-related sulfurtransferase